MAIQNINNNEQMNVVRQKINSNFKEISTYEEKYFPVGPSTSITIDGFTVDMSSFEFKLFIKDLSISTTSGNNNYLGVRGDLVLNGIYTTPGIGHPYPSVYAANGFIINRSTDKQFPDVLISSVSPYGGVKIPLRIYNNESLKLAFSANNEDKTFTISFLDTDGSPIYADYLGGYIIIHPITFVDIF